MENKQQVIHQISNDYNNDEIDLIELCKGLWQEKTAIIICIAVAGAIALAYLAISKPVYIASIELTKPSESALNKIKPTLTESRSSLFLYTPDAPLQQQQELIDLVQRNSQNSVQESQEDVSSKSTFAAFLSILTSRSQINSLIKNQPELLIQALRIDIDNDGAINSINKLRAIEYPNTKKKSNELAPDSYFLTYEGYDREALKKLITFDVKSASLSTVERLKKHYSEQLRQELDEHTARQKADLGLIEQRIAARKSYLRTTHQANIAQIKEKIDIAKRTLNDKTVTLLSAELQNLKQRSTDTFFDDDLFAMQAQKQLLANNNTYTSQLDSEIERLESQPSNILFSNNIIVSPESPIKPKNILAITLGIILGGFIGLIIAIGRYAYKKRFM